MVPFGRSGHGCPAPVRGTGPGTGGTDDEGDTMGANVGDRITMHANSTAAPDRVGTVVAVLGDDGPPYRVRFDSGEETIVSPGPDATIEPAGVRERAGIAADKAREAVGDAAERAREAAGDAADQARDSAEKATGTAARKVAEAADAVARRLGR